MERTLDEIKNTIKAALDSVWVISDEIQKLADGMEATTDRRGNIERNVSHLKLVVADQEIVDSGEDISELTQAITLGEAKLAEDIWQA